MRWFYIFLLVLAAWGGFVQVVLKDDAHRELSSSSGGPVS
jgi:hypothetical protein